MTRHSIRVLAWAGAAALFATATVLGARAQGATTPAEIAALLTELGGFSAADLESLQSGQVIARTETNPDLLEAGVVAAVKIATPKDRALTYFKTLISYVDGSVTTGYGVLSRPPAAADLKALSLARADIGDLENCVPGDCAIRVRAAAPGAPPPAVDWTAVDATGLANAWYRQELAAYAADYLSRGNSALVAFDDQSRPINLVNHWQQMADRSPVARQISPELVRYAVSFPANPVAGASDEVYWDQQHYLALKPILGLTHLVTLQDPRQPDRVVLLQKQIYASHYLYGSLALTLVLQDPASAASPVTYVVYVNRSRGDLLKVGQTQTPPPAQTGRGGLSGALAGLRAGVNSLSQNLQRRLGEQMIRQSAERLLGSMKEALER